MLPSGPVVVGVPKEATRSQPAQKTAHYVLSSHWDREWHHTFQRFRLELVDLLDGVLTNLDNGSLPGPFYCDGQAVVLEDYLEARPDKRDEVVRLLNNKQLVAGPWYTLPDEMIVSGESIIRNLRLGRELVRGLGGKPSDAGFLCDLFGHNSQMPQIFAGFGIHFGFIWRGTNVHEQRHLRWRGADGTELISHRFGKNGYWGYAVNARGFTDHNEGPDQKTFNTNLGELLQEDFDESATDHVLIFDGADHSSPDMRAMGQLQTAMANGDLDCTVKLGTLDDYAKDVLSQADRVTQVIEGELLEPAKYPLGVDDQWVITGCGSSRVWLKRANARCETLLCRWAEPMMAWSHLLVGQSRMDDLLEHAWKLLIQNHAHDSICGCSIDTVHEDMAYRFRQIEQIAENVAERSAKSIAAAVQSEWDELEERLVVFNPNPWAIEQQTVELAIRVPSSWPTAERTRESSLNKIPHFSLTDEAGRVIEYHRLETEMDKMRVWLPGRRALRTETAHRVRVVVRLDLPAMGYQTLRVRSKGAKAPASGYSPIKGLAATPTTLENDFLKIDAQPNGTINLTDKRTGRIFPGLLALEDNGECGDGWDHHPPQNDKLVSSHGATATISIKADTPLESVMSISVRLPVPKKFDKQAFARSSTDVDLIVEHTISLNADSDSADVKTLVRNTARDHRLRVVFPTSMQIQDYLADTPFDAVRRQIALPEDAADYREAPQELKAIQSWVAAWDGKHGLAVISHGVYEAGIPDRPDRPIVATLFRAFGRTPFTDGEIGGQALRDMHFDFRIKPLDAEPDAAELGREGQRLALPIRSVQIDRIADTELSTTADKTLSPTQDLLCVDGSAVITSTRLVNDGLEVRLNNLTPKDAVTTLRVSKRLSASIKIKEAAIVDFESRVKQALEADDDGGLAIEIGAKGIVTVRLPLAK